MSQFSHFASLALNITEDRQDDEVSACLPFIKLMSIGAEDTLVTSPKSPKESAQEFKNVGRANTKTSELLFGDRLFPRFLDLPPEIRDHIYRLVLGMPSPRPGILTSLRGLAQYCSHPPRGPFTWSTNQKVPP